MRSQTDRGGVLIVRVWFEPGHGSEDFRARITSTVDIESSRQEVTAETSPEAVTEVVRRWLARMLTQRPLR